MLSNTTLTDTANNPVFELCNPREERFLRDVMQRAGDLSRLRFPDVGVLLSAIEDATGGIDNKERISSPPGLLHQLAAYAHYADQLTHEERDRSREALAWYVYDILRFFMATVEDAIRQSTFIRHTDEGVRKSNRLCFISRQTPY